MDRDGRCEFVAGAVKLGLCVAGRRLPVERVKPTRRECVLFESSFGLIGRVQAGIERRFLCRVCCLSRTVRASLT